MAIASSAPRSRKIQPSCAHTHWVNAVAIFIMIGSGWRIFNDSPLFPLIFHPAITLGDVQVSFKSAAAHGWSAAMAFCGHVAACAERPHLLRLQSRNRAVCCQAVAP